MNILNLFALFLGISVPLSVVTLTINATLFGLLLGGLSLKLVNRYRLVMLSLSILVFDLIIYLTTKNFYFILASSLSILLAFIATSLFLKNTKKFIAIVLGLMIIGLGLVQFSEGKALRERFGVEPSPPYNSDMITYVAVVYSIKKGEDFYEALSKASQIQLNGRNQPEIWGWKQPMLFYLWKIFPSDGNSIVYLGIAMFSATLLAVYFIGRKFLSPVEALLCPYIVWPYFTFPLIEQTIAQVEWWALGSFVIGISLILHKRYWLTGLMFAVCLGIRELFVIPILAIVLVDLSRRELRQTIKLVLPTLFVLLPYYLFVHIPSISKYVDLQSLVNNSSRQNIPAGWEYIRPSLSYNSWSYALQDFRPFLILLFFNSIILMLRVFFRRTYLDLVILSSFLVFFLASLKIGTVDLWHDYWGIYYVPMLLFSTPISLNYLNEWFKMNKIGLRKL